MTRDRLSRAEGGASFAEVFVALALTLIGLAGAMGAFQASERSFRTGMLATRALAMAESRIEAKRSVRWDRLLLDDRRSTFRTLADRSAIKQISKPGTPPPRRPQPG